METFNCLPLCIRHLVFVLNSVNPFPTNRLNGFISPSFKVFKKKNRLNDEENRLHSNKTLEQVVPLVTSSQHYRFEWKVHTWQWGCCIRVCNLPIEGLLNISFCCSTAFACVLSGSLCIVPFRLVVSIVMAWPYEV